MSTLLRLIVKGCVGVLAVYGAYRLTDSDVESQRSENDLEIDLDTDLKESDQQ